MYPSTAELVEASTVAELTGLEQAQQDALRDEAILAVEGHCGQSFVATGTEDEPVTRTLDGAGGRVLYLPQRLAALSSVTVTGGVVTTDDVVLSDDNDRLSIPSERDDWTWATQAVAEMRGSRDLCFPTGPDSISVAGIWGWATVPDAVVTALRYDMEDRALANAHALSESVRSARALGLTGIDQGGLSVQLGGREPGVSTRVARLLADLIWTSTAGALA